MKHMKIKDYLFFAFLLAMAAVATSCEPEAVEVWPGEPQIQDPFDDSIQVPCDASCLYIDKKSS